MGLPEPFLSKAIRGVSKFGASIAKKFVKDSGLVDDDIEKIVEGVADGVERQADAGCNTSLKERAKLAG